MDCVIALTDKPQDKKPTAEEGGYYRDNPRNVNNWV